MNIVDLTQTVLLAITVAGMYAAIASGLTLEFGVTGIVNFAHGEFVMLGAFLTYFLYVSFGLSPLVGMLVAGIVMAAFSWLVFEGFLSRVLRQDEHNQILATIGLSIVLINVAMIAWSPDSRIMHAPDLLPTLRLGPVTIPGNNLFVLIVGAALYLGLFLFMRRTRYGLLLRFASDDPDLAVFAGVDVWGMFRLSFVIGGLTAGIAGGLVATILYVNPLVGADLVVRAFAIVALGGLGSIGGALVGAAILSVAEGLTATFVPGGGSWGYGVAFLIIVAVLALRPTGLFGSEQRGVTRTVARVLPYAVVVAIAGVIVHADKPFWLQIAIGVAISAVLALAWDILSRSGQVSLGTAAFFGLGAYATALLEPMLGLTLAWIGVVVTCTIAATLLGLLTLRLRRMYFAIATLGFTLSLQVAVLAFGEWTGGAGGIAPPVIADGEPRAQLMVVAALLLLAMAASDALLTIRFRPAFFMIRTKPELAAASGVPVVRAKMLAFIVSGILSGLAGGCYGGLYGYVVPGDVFTPNWSVLPLAITILGGMDTTLGPLLGAALLRALEEVARATIGGTGYQVVYGLVIIVFVMALPQGLVGILRSAILRLRADRTVVTPRFRTDP